MAESSRPKAPAVAKKQKKPTGGSGKKGKTFLEDKVSRRFGEIARYLVELIDRRLNSRRAYYP